MQSETMPTTAKLDDEHREMISEIKETYEIEPSVKKVVELGVEQLFEKRVEDGS